VNKWLEPPLAVDCIQSAARNHSVFTGGWIHATCYYGGGRLGLILMIVLILVLLANLN
jgi:Protein of unknown function (DUF3309)